jgi:NTP pyrophosphatase (non-canonical NTP hydrolase)
MNDLIKINQIIEDLMNKEDRQDAEFRLNLLTGEIGDLAKYITHDQVLNPNSRPYGSQQDEHMAYGQAFIQLIAAAQLRGVDIEQAITMALTNWQAADWRKPKINNNKELSGLPAQAGEVEAYIFLDPDCQNLDQLDNHILVTKYVPAATCALF